MPPPWPMPPPLCANTSDGTTARNKRDRNTRATAFIASPRKLRYEVCNSDSLMVRLTLSHTALATHVALAALAAHVATRLSRPISHVARLALHVHAVPPAAAHEPAHGLCHHLRLSRAPLAARPSPTPTCVSPFRSTATLKVVPRTAMIAVGVVAVLGLGLPLNFSICTCTVPRRT